MSKVTVTTIDTANGSVDLTLSTGNTSNPSVVISAASGLVTIGNTTVNTVANSSIIKVGANVIANTTAVFVGNSTVNTVVNSSIIKVGDNVIANTTAVFVGNSTVNTVVTSSSVIVANTTASFRLGTGAPDVIIEDQKTQGTVGGAFTAGADRTRTLNMLVRNVGTLASLATNQFTLPAGTYYITWSAPAYYVSRHQSWLYNVTDTAVVARGSSEYVGGGTIQARSVGSTVVTIAGSKAFEIRHRCETTQATAGFGIECNFGTEVYARVEIWKIS